MSSLQDQFNDLSFYTLAHQSTSFIHQHTVDAFTAQTANADTKPISIVFSLVGLYLFVEKNYTGRQVQQIHMQMAKNKKPWAAIVLPEERGNITVTDILATSPGRERDETIGKWCAAVWKAYQNNRETIIQLVQTALHL